jgi:hypothetical protein
MKQKTILLFICVTLIAPVFVHAAWVTPTLTPPLGNLSGPIHLGSSTHTKIGGLILNTGGGQYGLLVPLGLVGIGTLTPASALSVNGGLQIGDDNGACVSGKAGTMRWHLSQFQVCTGSSWTAL